MGRRDQVGEPDSEFDEASDVPATTAVLHGATDATLDSAASPATNTDLE